MITREIIEELKQKCLDYIAVARPKIVIEHFDHFFLDFEDVETVNFQLRDTYCYDCDDHTDFSISYEELNMDNSLLAIKIREDQEKERADAEEKRKAREAEQRKELEKEERKEFERLKKKFDSNPPYAGQK